MNKSELIDAIASKADVSKIQAGKMVEAFVESVMESVANGEDVRLIGFGTFAAADRAARVGRNPHTGETIQIPACRLPKFTAGAQFKALLK